MAKDEAAENIEEKVEEENLEDKANQEWKKRMEKENKAKEMEQEQETARKKADEVLYGGGTKDRSSELEQKRRERYRIGLNVENKPELYKKFIDLLAKQGLIGYKKKLGKLRKDLQSRLTKVEQNISNLHNELFGRNFRIGRDSEVGGLYGKYYNLIDRREECEEALNGIEEIIKKQEVMEEEYKTEMKNAEPAERKELRAKYAQLKQNKDLNYLKKDDLEDALVSRDKMVRNLRETIQDKTAYFNWYRNLKATIQEELRKGPSPENESDFNAGMVVAKGLKEIMETHGDLLQRDAVIKGDINKIFVGAVKGNNYSPGEGRYAGDKTGFAKLMGENKDKMKTEVEATRDRLKNDPTGDYFF